MAETREISKRDLTLDVAKGLVMVMVVLLHLHYGDANFDLYAHAILMQLIFIVSGILFDPNKTINYMLRSRARALLLPYLFFGGAYGIVYVARNLLSYDTEAILSGLKIMVLFPMNGFPYESALWFLPVMFWTSVGYAVIRNHLDLRLASVTVLAIGLLGFTFPALADFRLPWGLDTACVSLLYFHTGYLIKHYALMDRLKRFRAKRPWLFRLSFLIAAIANFLLVLLNGQTNLRLIQYGNPVMAYANGVTGAIVWLLIAEFICTSLFLTKLKALLCELGRLSIFILCTNHISIRVFKKIFFVLGVKTPLVYYLAVFCCAMAFMLFAGRIIEKTKLRIALGRKL